MSEFGEPPIDLSPSAFIRGAVEEGLSGAETLQLFRSYGARIGNETFYELFGDIRSMIGNRSQLQGLDYDAVPPGTAFTDWAAGAPDQYATFVEVHVRSPGVRSPDARFFTYVTAEPHTPREAEQWAIDQATQAAESGGTFAGQTILGATVTSFTRTVGRR